MVSGPRLERHPEGLGGDQHPWDHVVLGGEVAAVGDAEAEVLDEGGEVEEHGVPGEGLPRAEPPSLGMK